MNGKRAKKLRKYARKLMEIHPDYYKDRTVLVRPSRHSSFKKYPTYQRFSGFRLALHHAELGLELERGF